MMPKQLDTSIKTSDPNHQGQTNNLLNFPLSTSYMLLPEKATRKSYQLSHMQNDASLKVQFQNSS